MRCRSLPLHAQPVLRRVVDCIGSKTAYERLKVTAIRISGCLLVRSTSSGPWTPQTSPAKCPATADCGAAFATLDGSKSWTFVRCANRPLARLWSLQVRDGCEFSSLSGSLRRRITVAFSCEILLLAGSVAHAVWRETAFATAEADDHRPPAGARS
jgi:hypothetical protein